MKAEQLTDPICDHGEGAVYSDLWGENGALRCVDMLAGDMLEISDDGHLLRRRHVGKVAAVIRPRASGGFLVAGERNIGFADSSDLDADLDWTPDLWDDTSIRMNDGGCAPDGSFYVGSMAYDETPGAAKLYRVAPDQQSTVVLPHVTISNGIGWSDDGSVAYYNDTPTNTIQAFDWSAEEGLTNNRVLARPDSPDGLCTDAEGGVWVARFGHGRAERYDARGRLDIVVEVPAAQVTSVTFAGPELDRLVITTSRHGLEHPEPLAGALFTATPGMRGARIRPFAG